MWQLAVPCVAAPRVETALCYRKDERICDIISLAWSREKILAQLEPDIFSKCEVTESKPLNVTVKLDQLMTFRGLGQKYILYTPVSATVLLSFPLGAGSAI